MFVGDTQYAAAGLPFPVHVHTLRHCTEYAAPALPRTRLDKQYCSLHGDVARTVQRYLAVIEPQCGFERPGPPLARPELSKPDIPTVDFSFRFKRDRQGGEARTEFYRHSLPSIRR
jgi:hypothetical protein